MKNSVLSILGTLVILAASLSFSQEDKNMEYRQFNKFSSEYAQLAEIDPAKKYIQYPEALRLLGDVGKTLDIGCGNGTFTRMLARRGAKVFAYDPARKIVEEALQEGREEKLGIEYSVAMRLDESRYGKFDKAVSTMVLLYATNLEELRNIFSDAFLALKPGGIFVSITFNPNYKSFGKVANNRRITKTPDRRIHFNFLDKNGKTAMSSTASNFSVSDFETAAREAGFKKIEWVKLEVTSEGREAMGNAYWEGFDNDPSYIGLVVSRND
ncbi:MAG: methyltransferase domain-containing protein [Parcubacteria group bacterium]|jgi:SAM-dependent methyltransferase